MNSDVDVAVEGDVALVTVKFDNDAPVDRRVRLRNRLDGPVLPPRRDGVPASGWDDDGFEGTVPAESTIALGYACPAASLVSGTGSESVFHPDSDLDPSTVVDIDVLGRADEVSASRRDISTAADVVRELGTSRPPADAVPAAVGNSSSAAGDVAGREPAVSGSDSVDTGVSDAVGDETTRDDCVTDAGNRISLPSETEPTDSQPQTRELSIEPESEFVSESGSERETEPASEPEPEPEPEPEADPVPVSPATNQQFDASLLDRASRRIELAERLDGASVAEAATALTDSDARIEDVESLDAERDRLRRLAARATALADRAADADPDVDALRRLA
ncbi:hypothetical protein C440_08307 [Haloferax mucosum ATCC BAA-1512]|uniref:DUF8080 domain-containing protein n=1 Tax=Haloferax mucosum ATCC BAA-1512 TaxID=662479 RepID=M0IHZ6_9EURY|nr:hypothetical protein [Haloferax mucosum]ELZ95064.1 hypothetical protein C440_08307 [Haloferax mucosum ATCC BAA-1512]